MMSSKTIPLGFASEDEQMSANVETIIIEEKAAAVDPSVWIDLYGDTLFRFAFLRLRDETLAEDMVQETLLAAIQSLDKFAGGASELTWLVSILKHKIIDYYRKNCREIQFSEEDTDLSGFDHFFKREDEWDGHWRINLRPVGISETPEAILERAEFWAVMKNCLSALPARVANVFALREMDGLTSEEICEVMCLSPSNFWVIMHRARMQLRTCVEFKWLRKAD